VEREADPRQYLESVVRARDWVEQEPLRHEAPERRRRPQVAVPVGELRGDPDDDRELLDSPTGARVARRADGDIESDRH